MIKPVIVSFSAWTTFLCELGPVAVDQDCVPKIGRIETFKILLLLSKDRRLFHFPTQLRPLST